MSEPTNALPSAPLATIGISTYNRADGYLSEALRSALRQTYSNLEIIVSDNCSQDHTEELVRSFRDPRIRYFRQARNLGVNGNFNFCLEQARGSYFLLLHDDDLIDPDFIQVCMDAVGDKEVGVIRTGTRRIDSRGHVLSESRNRVGGRSTAEFILGWFRRETSIYFCSMMYNTRRLIEIGGFQSKTDLFQDAVAAVRLASRFGRVDVPDVKASFRRHDANNGTTARVADWCEDSLYLLDVMCEEAPEEAEHIRQAGMPYFCRKNYRQARSIPSRIRRLSAYWMVFRTFEYSYSPWSFVYSRARPVKRARSIVRRALPQRA